MLVSHAGCGQEQEVRSRVQRGGKRGVHSDFLHALKRSADHSVSTAVTSGKDVIHPEEGRKAGRHDAFCGGFFFCD